MSLSVPLHSCRCRMDLAVQRHNAVLIKRIFIFIVVLVALRIIAGCGLLLSMLRDRWSASHGTDRPRAPSKVRKVSRDNNGPSQRLLGPMQSLLGMERHPEPPRASWDPSRASRDPPRSKNLPDLRTSQIQEPPGNLPGMERHPEPPRAPSRASQSLLGPSQSAEEQCNWRSQWVLGVSKRCHLNPRRNK